MKYDSDNFQKDVIEKSHQIPVLVDFWAEWCGPCKALGPMLERLAEKHKDRWTLVKIDTEKYPQLAMQYDIRSIPNVKLFVNGEFVNEFAGALPEDAIERWLEKVLPGKYTEQLEQAQKLLSEGQLARAQQLLQQVLAAEPGSEPATVLLAQTLLYSDSQKAVELVSHIEEDSEYFQLVETIRAFGKMFEHLQEQNGLPDSPVREPYLEAIGNLQSGNFSAALEGFIEVLQTDRYYDDDGSRKACIAIFKYLGEDNPITRKYRAAFSSALYL